MTDKIVGPAVQSRCQFYTNYDKGFEENIKLFQFY